MDKNCNHESVEKKIGESWKCNHCKEPVDILKWEREHLPKISKEENE